MFSPPAKVRNQQGGAALNRWWGGTFWGVLRVQSHALLLFTTVPLCFFWATTSGFCIETKVYHAERSMTDVELGSQSAQKSKKRRSTTILLCYICLKHFTVQKCWKLWSSFLLLFKEKINAVITSVRFPSWKHGHEIRLLGFHFDGGMSEWYWDVDVYTLLDALGVDCVSVCQTCVANSSEQDNWKKQSKAQTACIQQLNATDWMQILKWIHGVCNIAAPL